MPRTRRKRKGEEETAPEKAAAKASPRGKGAPKRPRPAPSTPKKRAPKKQAPAAPKKRAPAKKGGPGKKYATPKKAPTKKKGGSAAKRKAAPVQGAGGPAKKAAAGKAGSKRNAGQKSGRARKSDTLDAKQDDVKTGEDPGRGDTLDAKQDDVKTEEEPARRPRKGVPARRVLKAPAAVPGIGSLSDLSASSLSFDVLQPAELVPLLSALGQPTDGNRMELLARLRAVVREGLRAAQQQPEHGAPLPLPALPPGPSLPPARPAAAAKPDDIPAVLENPTFEEVGAALDSIDVPVNKSRKNVKLTAEQEIRGMCIGVVGGRANGIITSKFVRQRPNLTRTLVNFCKQHNPGFVFTSIQVNKNYLSAMHVDKNNLGPSYIVGVGDYTEGGLWYQPRGEVQCRHKWQLFDGNIRNSPTCLLLCPCLTLHVRLPQRTARCRTRALATR